MGIKTGENMETNQIKSLGSIGAPPSLGDASVQSKDKPFSADAAMNAALNYNLDLILKLGSVTLSMGNMMTTIQKTAVKNSMSKVEMFRKLLSGQGLASNDHWFYDLIKPWGDPFTQQEWIAKAGGDKVLAFKMYCDSKEGMGKFFDDVYNSPSITDFDKKLFVEYVTEWGLTPDLTTFIGKITIVSNLLGAETSNVDYWQKLAETMKPSQIQQAITTLIAEIGQFTNMWSSVIAS